MKKFGLIGCPIGHSLSPKLHNYIADYEYTLNEIEGRSLDDFISNTQLDGFNVTIPYKVDIMGYLDEISPLAQRIGAVNTVVRRAGHADFGWYGDNTDYAGLKELLKYNDISLFGKIILILGTGGAAKMAKTLCEDGKAAGIYMASRDADMAIRKFNAKAADSCKDLGGGSFLKIIGYEDIYNIERADVLINATPVGMYPDTALVPADIGRIKGLESVVDMISNPIRTQLLVNAKRQGLKTAGGLYMLVAQAVYASYIFMGKNPKNNNGSGETDNNCSTGIFDDYGSAGTIGKTDEEIRKIIEKVYRQIKTETENIIFVGMPGCGKTTCAQILAKEIEENEKESGTLKREFVKFIDTDELIEKRTGMSIPEIFDKYGEEYFRDIEEDVIKEAALKSGCVIATGGGSILRENNRNAMKRSGFVIYIDADIDKLATFGRPLSAGQKALEDMYAVRDKLYRDTADIVIRQSDFSQFCAKFCDHMKKCRK